MATKTVANADTGQSASVAMTTEEYDAFEMSRQKPPKAMHVIAERERRLALGFSYDFGDGRGVHQIGTTPADMTGWRDVNDHANSLITTGNPATEIIIETNTEPVTVTAQEWQKIMLHLTTFRQKMWLLSQELQKRDPIPNDYRNDRHWQLDITEK